MPHSPEIVDRPSPRPNHGPDEIDLRDHVSFAGDPTERHDDRDADEDPGAEYRRAGLAAIVLVALLNVADVVLTQLLLNRNAVELNPIVAPLLASNLALVVKLGIVAALAVDFIVRRPRLITLCVLWLVAGFYLCAVIVNGTQLVATWNG